MFCKALFKVKEIYLAVLKVNFHGLLKVVTAGEDKSTNDTFSQHSKIEMKFRVHKSSPRFEGWVHNLKFCCSKT